ncbi:response regulator [Paenibacillus sp. MMS20-IR301]|uniref:response regulator transcription factor n=1 Tax=Paenibacillus sp. MMS20-IR301 TaxID=2895946 RepID=UPI0028ECE607|nr:response regulator [Paenibacillus sp. MMS20-IR301]WNS43140.1 response regulator [Paenibacillus sp. MMS20-IR301]
MYKVLIVDDELIVRHAVKSLIRWEDSRFEYAGSAANGAQALELITKTGADIVITDIKMSEMDGLELIKQLFKTSFTGEILVLSNYNDYDLVREALKCGAHDYMLKLTLKTEDFMASLAEIALKLDQKNSRRTRQIPLAAGTAEVKEQIAEWLKETDAGLAAGGDYAGRNAVAELLAGPPALQAYTFGIHVLKEGRSGQAAVKYQEMLYKIAESLLPGNRGLYVAAAGPERFLLLLVSPVPPAGGPAPAPQELAQRIKGLSKIYYNVEVTAVYGDPSRTWEGVAGQIGRVKEAAVLSFYTDHQENCIYSGRAAGSREEEQQFRVLENQFKDSLRHMNGTEIDLWLESATMLVRAAAELCIPPSSLKRAMIGGIWGLFNSKPVSGEVPWNESEWVEKVESACTDSHVLLIIQDMYDEIMNRIGKTAGYKFMREEIRLANAYLEQHFAERVFISEVAAHVGFSEPYLCQVFKAETGSSILTRLNEIRMTKAYEMLSSGNYLIKQVAMEIGIPDPFYFNRLFKKRFGVAPKTVKKIR